jgi:V/A-type H+/Na+-transporting ATPase subunit K
MWLTSRACARNRTSEGANTPLNPPLVRGEEMGGCAEERVGKAIRNDAAPARSRRAVRWFVGVNVGLALLSMFVFVTLLASVGGAADVPAARMVPGDQVVMWGFLAAAASTAIASLAAAYAVSHVGAAAMAAIGERPELAGRALIFVGLAEGIAIYGLIVSIMILTRLG